MTSVYAAARSGNCNISKTVVKHQTGDTAEIRLQFHDYVKIKRKNNFLKIQIDLTFKLYFQIKALIDTNEQHSDGKTIGITYFKTTYLIT